MRQQEDGLDRTGGGTDGRAGPPSCLARPASMCQPPKGAVCLPKASLFAPPVAIICLLAPRARRSRGCQAQLAHLTPRLPPSMCLAQPAGRCQVQSRPQHQICAPPSTNRTILVATRRRKDPRGIWCREQRGERRPDVASICINVAPLECSRLDDRATAHTQDVAPTQNNYPRVAPTQPPREPAR